jgi:hypothetical protein
MGRLSKTKFEREGVNAPIDSLEQAAAALCGYLVNKCRLA